MWFYGYGFLPTVLEAVLEAARQKTSAVPCLNRSPLFIGYGFYNYDKFIAPFLSVYFKIAKRIQSEKRIYD